MGKNLCGKKEQQIDLGGAGNQKRVHPEGPDLSWPRNLIYSTC